VAFLHQPRTIFFLLLNITCGKKSKTNVNVGPHPPWIFEFDDGPDENIGKRFFIRVACSWMVLASSKNVQKEVSQFTVMVTHGAPSSSDFFFTLAQSAIQHPAADERVALAKFRDYMTRAYTHAHADAPLARWLLDFYLCTSAICILTPCGGRASVYLGVL
jgi:hypothetical protein